MTMSSNYYSWLMFRQHTIFGMMWCTMFLNIQNQSAAGNVIQLNKKKRNMDFLLAKDVITNSLVRQIVSA